MKDAKEPLSHTSDNARSLTLDRRRLILSAPALGAGAMLAPAAYEDNGAQPAEDDVRRVSYRETAHIREYYRKARFR